MLTSVLEERAAARWTASATAICEDGRELRMRVETSGPKLRAVLPATGRPARLAEYAWTFRVELDGASPPRVHHHALPRLHRRMTVPAQVPLGAEGLPRTNYATPGNHELPAGWQDMMLHPACVVFSPEGPRFLVGPLTQREAAPGYRWRMADPRVVELRVSFRLHGRPGWELAADADFWSEHLHVETADDGAPGFGPHVFESYHAALEAAGLRGRARGGPLARHELFWGSWNEGNYRRIDEALILREAEWIAKNLPNVRWIQLDDGYQSDANPDGAGSAAGMADLGAHAEEETAYCRRRFPRGMRALTDSIRALGLRPMVWFSPACIVSRKLFKERPDLFVPDKRLHFVDALAFPDFSRPEVRALAERALDRLFDEWGFEGIKLDFWSYQFLQTRLTLAEGEAGNLSWLRWLETEIRRRVGPEGLMLSCLEPANGDPFRSDVWDLHRVGPDIDGLQPHVIEEIALWIATLTALKGLHTRFWAPDGDGLSLFRHAELSDERWRMATTLLVVSGACAEIAGRLSEQADDARMPAFRRILARARHGRPVECPGYDWVENAGRAPSVWWRRDADEPDLLGMINWTDAPAGFAVPEALRGREATELFGGVPETLGASRRIPAGDAALWSVG